MLLRFVDALELDGVSVEQDLAAVAAGGVEAREHLDERALARAVLAAESVHLARLEVQGNAVEGPYAREVLGDGPQLE